MRNPQLNPKMAEHHIGWCTLFEIGYTACHKYIPNNKDDGISVCSKKTSRKRNVFLTTAISFEFGRPYLTYQKQTVASCGQ